MAWKEILRRILIDQGLESALRKAYNNKGLEGNS